ncbi:MAG: hypothetical protein KUG79_11265 [Pseudomonadales bacterium]|nr:hypothetical protein [Pseudomonadales bacterium]
MFNIRSSVCQLVWLGIYCLLSSCSDNGRSDRVSANDQSGSLSAAQNQVATGEPQADASQADESPADETEADAPSVDDASQVNESQTAESQAEPSAQAAFVFPEPLSEESLASVVDTYHQLVFSVASKVLDEEDFGRRDLGNNLFTAYFLLQQFAQLALTAEAETAVELQQAFPAVDDLSAIPVAVEMLNRSIFVSNLTQVEHQSKIWLQQGYPFTEQYLSSLSHYFGADIEIVDFFSELSATLLDIDNQLQLWRPDYSLPFFPAKVRLIGREELAFNINHDVLGQSAVQVRGFYKNAADEFFETDLIELTGTFNSLRTEDFQVVNLVPATEFWELLIITRTDGSNQNLLANLESYLQQYDANASEALQTVYLPDRAFSANTGFDEVFEVLGIERAFFDDIADLSSATAADMLYYQVANSRENLQFGVEGISFAALGGGSFIEHTRVVFNDDMNFGSFSITHVGPSKFCIKEQVETDIQPFVALVRLNGLIVSVATLHNFGGSLVCRII